MVIFGFCIKSWYYRGIFIYFWKLFLGKIMENKIWNLMGIWNMPYKNLNISSSIYATGLKFEIFHIFDQLYNIYEYKLNPRYLVHKWVWSDMELLMMPNPFSRPWIVEVDVYEIVLSRVADWGHKYIARWNDAITSWSGYKAWWDVRRVTVVHPPSTTAVARLRWSGTGRIMMRWPDPPPP